MRSHLLIGWTMDSLARRILIADGHDVVRGGMRSLMESHSYMQIVAEAATGADALVAAREFSPDIAIIDHCLPDLNGVDLTQSLRREIPRIEVLVYTTH